MTALPRKEGRQREQPASGAVVAAPTSRSGRGLKRSRLAQDEALATGEGYFCPVLEDKDITHQVDNACMLDVFEVDDAVAAGAKEFRLDQAVSRNHEGDDGSASTSRSNRHGCNFLPLPAGVGRTCEEYNT